MNKEQIESTQPKKCLGCNTLPEDNPFHSHQPTPSEKLVIATRAKGEKMKVSVYPKPDWQEKFDKQFVDQAILEVSVLHMWTKASDVKEFISSLLAQKEEQHFKQNDAMYKNHRKTFRDEKDRELREKIEGMKEHRMIHAHNVDDAFDEALDLVLNILK